MEKKGTQRIERRGRFTIREIDGPSSIHNQLYKENFDTEPSALDRQSSIGSVRSAFTDEYSDTMNLVEQNEDVLEDKGMPPLTLEHSGDGTCIDTKHTTLTTNTEPDQRIKRKGRFTIIELSTSSPTSRNEDDKLQEFSNTTSISVSSTQIAQASSLSCLQQSMGAATEMHSPEEGGGMQQRGRSSTSRPSAMTTHQRSSPPRTNSRMRSASPVRARREAQPASRSGIGNSVGSLPFRHQSAGHPHHHHHTSSASQISYPSHSPTSSNGLNLSPTSRLTTSVSSSSIASVSSTSSLAASGVSAGDKRQIPLEIGAGRRHLASTRQKAITISVDQFLQQQQTIASLIRQQQDLKQLIGVLQEQQQHLMKYPVQLNELSKENEQRDIEAQSTRELHMQVDVLTRANESLQSLLTQAEHDAQEHVMEIQYLSEENDELRHRYAIVERKYLDERKISFALEQQLQHAVRYSLRTVKSEKQISGRSRLSNDESQIENRDESLDVER